jgi:hypothetical protein
MCNTAGAAVCSLSSFVPMLQAARPHLALDDREFVMAEVHVLAHDANVIPHEICRHEASISQKGINLARSGQDR